MTGALRAESGGISVHVLQALTEAGAVDPSDGCITRDWALGLMTNEDALVDQLTRRGINSDEIRRLVALIQRHPTPAAGG